MDEQTPGLSFRKEYRSTQANTNDLNDAIIIYLAFGNTPWRQEDATRLIKEFGVEKAAELELQVLSLLDELARFSIDWSETTLASAGDLARAHMQNLHPHLNETALRALVWKFTYDWR